MTLFATLLILAAARPAEACSLCANLQQVPTFRQEAAQPQARIIVYGTFKNGKVGVGTDFHVGEVLRTDKFIEGKSKIAVPKYIPTEDGEKPFLLFADVYMDKLDVYRGVPIKTAAGVEYVKKVLKLDPKKKAENLRFFFDYLENADREVANDAFMEFAKATDLEIGEAASQLPADKLRSWLDKKDTPPERLGLYSFLLGACGNKDDAPRFESMLREKDERTTKAFDGILAGYVRLRPKEGWELALATLKDDKQSFEVRLAVSRMMRFFYLSQPKENKANVLKGMEIMLAKSDLADVAIEDLRRLKLFDLTSEVLGLYGKKGYDAPIMRENIVRYALTCKDDAAAQKFIAERRKAEPELVQDVEDGLRFEKPK
jgi:hypothetical protein